MMVRHSAPIPPVVVQSETTKNKHYAELQYPDNPPRVPPPCDTVVVYSQIPHYLQVNIHLSLLCKSRTTCTCTSTIVKYFTCKKQTYILVS